MANEPRQENPPLGKSFVAGYSAENTAYPILHIKKDPRASNYKTPDLGDPHPEAARYPNHTYQGTVKTDTDDRVIWVYEILDGPTISGKVITPEGQIGVLTQQEVVPGTTVTPSALMVSGKVDPLTSGKSIKETVTVPSVFPETQKSKQQSTKIPERFFSDPVATESSVAAATDTTPSVGTHGVGVLEQSKQLVTEFTVKTNTTTAPGSTEQITGQEYDKVLGIPMPFTMDIVTTFPTGDAVNANPLAPSVWEVKADDLAEIHSALDNIYIVYPSREQIQLPDVLVSVEVFWDAVGTESTQSFSSMSAELVGILGTEFSLECNAVVSGDFNVVISEGFNGHVPVEIHTFFLPFTSGELATNAIISKIQAKIGKTLSEWPVYRAKSDTVVLMGEEKSARLTTKVAAAIPQSSAQEPIPRPTGIVYFDTYSKRASKSVRILHIPPTIHPQITISESGENEATGTATSASGAVLEVDVTGTLSTYAVEATNVTEFPVGTYLKTAEVKLYEHGYAMVTAVVVEVTEEMVEP